PPDFNATAIALGSATEQRLVVEWVNGGATAPFTSANTSGLVVDLSNANLGSVHHIVTVPGTLDLTRPGTYDLKLLPTSPPFTIAQLREIARRRVPGFAFEYVEGGAEDEVTLRGNRDALERLRLIPQTLIDTSARHQRIAIFGRPANAPLIIAPTGLNGMLHPQGDLALARAAARLGIPFTLSTLSTTRLEELATRAGGRLWLQLYVLKERAI